MAKLQYAPRTFLRQVPNSLLDSYFHRQNLLIDLDIASLEESNVELLFEAWQGLPEDIRARIDRDFQDVHLMADKRGLQTILDEAHYHSEALENELADLDEFHAQALWVLLERQEYFDVAIRFKVADELPTRYWEQRINFPDLPPRDDQATCAQLSCVLQALFRSEGRGNLCVVEPFRRDERYYFFAYIEDHAQTLLEFQQADLTKRVVRPAFDVVFVSNPQRGTLSTFFQGPRKVLRELQTIFARCMLAMDLPTQPKDERVYNLEQLKFRDFQFVVDPRTGVQELCITQLKLGLPGSRKPRWTAEVDPGQEPQAIYAELDRLFATDHHQNPGDRFPLALTKVLRVGIRAYYPPPRGRRRPTRNFSLSYPNGCNLDHEGPDAILREVLIASHIELQSSRPDAEAA